MSLTNLTKTWIRANFSLMLSHIFGSWATYDLFLAKSDNLSTSPGFESLGLRVNNKRKRKRDEIFSQ